MTAVELECPECGAKMTLRKSRFGQFYGCSTWPKCDAAHGAHPDGTPLGVPANKATKQARIKAHEAFDTLWKGGRMKRSEAYSWMASALGLTAAEAHIGRFDIPTCERLVEAVRTYGT